MTDGSSGMDPQTRAAFNRLLKLAQADTHSSKRAADFILAWWNAESLGGWNPIDITNVDQPIADDMMAVLSFLAGHSGPAYTHEYRSEIQELITQWRPREDDE